MKIHGNISEISNEFLRNYFERNFRISKNASAKSAVRAQLTITKRTTAHCTDRNDLLHLEMQFYGRRKAEKTSHEKKKLKNMLSNPANMTHNGIIQSCL